MKNNKLLDSSSLFLLPFFLFIGLGITRILKVVGSDAWISIIIGTFIGLFFNYLLTKLPKEDNKITSYISNSLLLLLGVMTLTKLLSSLYLDQTSNELVMIPFILLIWYSSKKTRFDIMKVISILAIIYLSFSLFAGASLVSGINIDYFRPVGINNPLNILLGSLEYALYSTLPLVVLPNFKEKYNYKTYLLSSLFLLIIIILIIGNLGVKLSMSYRYPEYMLFKNIAVLDFIENIQNVLFFIWIINIYTLSSHSILNIKELVGNKGVFITLILEFIIINLFLVNNYKVPIIFINYLDYILLGIFIIYLIGKIKTHK